MGVGAGLYMYVVVIQKFTFAISSPDEFLLKFLLHYFFNGYAYVLFFVTYSLECLDTAG